MHPILYSWRDTLPSTIVRLLAYLGGAAVLSIVAAHLMQPRPMVASIMPKPRPEWAEVERPFAAFAVTIPEAAGAPRRYAIRRNTDGGGRKDVLSLGEPNGTTPYLLVEIYRPGSEIGPFGDPAKTIDMLTAGLGTAKGMQGGGDVGTKFGPFPVVNFTVDNEGPRRCLGFAHAFSDPRLQVAGVFCRPGTESIDTSSLACALDRLTLVAAGSEPKVQKLFAQAELHRSFCGQRDPIIAATPKYKLLWKALANRPESRRAGR